MKKITASLGNSHNDFDRQLKELLNEMGETIDRILCEQQIMNEYQNKIFLKHHAETLQSILCDMCHRKADMVTTDLSDGTYRSFCNSCLTKQ